MPPTKSSSLIPLPRSTSPLCSRPDRYLLLVDHRAVSRSSLRRSSLGQLISRFRSWNVRFTSRPNKFGSSCEFSSLHFHKPAERLSHTSVSVRLTMFLIIRNDAVLPIANSYPGCPQDDNGLCSFDTVLTALRQRVQEIDFEYDCFGN